MIKSINIRETLTHHTVYVELCFSLQLNEEKKKIIGKLHTQGGY